MDGAVRVLGPHRIPKDPVSAVSRAGSVDRAGNTLRETRGVHAVTVPGLEAPGVTVTQRATDGGHAAAGGGGCWVFWGVLGVFWVNMQDM